MTHSDCGMAFVYFSVWLLMILPRYQVDSACADAPVSFKSVNESSAVGYAIQAVDATSYSGTFTISPSQFDCYFSVSGGALTLARQINLENLTSCVDGSTTPLASVPNNVQITLACSSGASENLILRLVDINEFAPAFNPSVLFANISESASVGDFVIELKSYVRDADKSNQATFNFALLTGANGKFNMPDSITSGIVRVAGVLDYDAGERQFALNISAAELASNSGSVPGPLTGYATVQIAVTDADDQNPAFLSSGYALSFMENDSSILGKDLSALPEPLQAWDLDLGINQTVNYAIDFGSVLNTATFLAINASTGRLSVTSLLDRETLAENPMWLRVRAYQTDKPNLRTAVAFVSVTVTDRNDNWPIMSAGVYAARLAENSPNDTFVAQVAATDADYGSNATLVYKLTDASGAFVINSTSGSLRVANSNLLDRETTAQFNLTVWAEESLTVERYASAPSRLIVQLLDANDNAPVFSQASYAFSASTSAGIGAIVGAVQATDADVGQNAVVSFSLAFGSPAGSAAYFRLDSANGSLTVAAPLTGLSSVSEAVLLVVAEDQALPVSLRQRSTAAVTVALTSETTTPTAVPGGGSTAPAAATTATPAAATTTLAAAATATVWNSSTSVLSTRQLNASHLILEVQTVIYDLNGRTIRFNQSTLVELPVSTSASTTGTTSAATVSESATSASAVTSVTAGSPTSSKTETATSASPTTPSASQSADSTSGGATAQESSSSSGQQTVFIALCALIAALLLAALVAIYCLWKRRPAARSRVSVRPAGSPAQGRSAGSSGVADDGAVKHPAGHGSHAQPQPSKSKSSRLNYSEFTLTTETHLALQLWC